MLIKPTNWASFQHYKDRNPPWIRLHKNLLDNYEFHQLPVESRAIAPLLWLLASESRDQKTGIIDADPAKLAFRLRMSTEQVIAAIRPLINLGFFVEDQPGSTMLSNGLQSAIKPLALCLEPQKTDIPEVVPYEATEQKNISNKQPHEHAGNELILLENKGHASAVLADRKQLAVPETETEAETERTIVHSDLTANYPAGFLRFWAAWPPGHRKSGKANCLKIWKRLKAEKIAEVIVAHVSRAKTSPDWTKEAGAFVPLPSTYLNQQRWSGSDPLPGMNSATPSYRLRAGNIEKLNGGHWCVVHPGEVPEAVLNQFKAQKDDHDPYQ